MIVETCALAADRAIGNCAGLTSYRDRLELGCGLSASATVPMDLSQTFPSARVGNPHSSLLGSQQTGRGRAPSPASGETKLVSISRVASNSCIAAGSVGAVSDPYDVVTTTLVERWNGSAWFVMPTPNPRGSLEAGLPS